MHRVFIVLLVYASFHGLSVSTC